MSWIRQSHVNLHATMRLFCFPFAGGSAQAFEQWGEKLPPFVELCCVQLPGRNQLARVAPYTSMPELLRALYEQISPWLQAKPFVFYGHSLGGLIAFELAKKLEHERAHLRKIVISGCSAPALIAQYGSVHLLPDDLLIARLKQMGGTPLFILENAAFLKYYLPLLRADLFLFHAYDYMPQEATIATPITAIGGVQDHFVTADRIHAWKDETTEVFQAHFIEGDHFFIENNRELFLNLLANEL